jgi:hypothetical protein
MSEGVNGREGYLVTWLQRGPNAAALGAATLCAVGWLCVTAVFGSGCQSDAAAHPFFASSYDPSTGCLGAAAINDVLDGPDPGVCNQPVCWINQRGDAFVSFTMCDGPPDWTRVDKPMAGSLCEQALAAGTQWGAGKCAPEAGADGPQSDGGEGVQQEGGEG